MRRAVGHELAKSWRGGLGCGQNLLFGFLHIGLIIAHRPR